MKRLLKTNKKVELLFDLEKSSTFVQPTNVELLFNLQKLNFCKPFKFNFCSTFKSST